MINIKNNIAITVIGSIVSLFVGINGTILFYELTADDTVIQSSEIIENITVTEADSIASSVDKVYDAVFTVETSSLMYSNIGTGFVYKIEGDSAYLLTNNHVVDGATKIEISNHNGEKTEATLMGSDELLDLAVIKVDSSFTPMAVSFGNSDEVLIGDTVFAVGTPISTDYRGTVTKGIISGLDREVTVDSSDGDSIIMNVIQTNTAINPGNSGGPLVNINGEVIGINTLKLVEDEIEGMGFAIPIEMAESVLSKLESGEEIVRPRLGITLIDANNDYALSYNDIILDKIYSEGIVIIETEKGSAAENAGLKSEDVVLTINGETINDSTHFKYLLYKYEIGETVKLTVIRDGKEISIDVLLIEG